MTKIQITKGLEEKIKDKFDNDLEFSVWMLAEREEEDLRVIELDFIEGKENSV